MPKPGSIAADVVEVLRGQPKGLYMGEIVKGLRDRRGAQVLETTVRSIVYQNVDDAGQRLFVRVGREGPRKTRYALR